MKHEYKIDTGLWYYQRETSKDREKFMFNTDEEAWNKLRLVIPNKFATLFRKESVSVLINNHKNVIEHHNRKYKEQQMKSESVDNDERNFHEQFGRIKTIGQFKMFLTLCGVQDFVKQLK